MKEHTYKCNFCKKEFEDVDNRYHIETMMGYGSRFDMMKLDMTLCPDCIDWLIDMCGISPVSDVEENIEN